MTRSNCAVNVLPQRLEDCWGRVLTKHGSQVDAQPDVAQYLSRAEAEYLRLIPHNGVFYMFGRSRDTYGTIVRADSRGIGWQDAQGKKAPAMMFPGYAGFALSMGRELYMAHHRGGFSKGNFFHSSYLAGNSVQCTGTLYIENGILMGVANNSGHYQPSLDHLRNVAECLVMHGVHMPGVQFFAMWPSLPADVQSRWQSYGTYFTFEGMHYLGIRGDVMMQMRSRGHAMANRLVTNAELIRKRGGWPPGARFGTP